jgi:hypothetical protein
MVAVCPSCHDSIHYGLLEIDDSTVYAWKGMERDGKHMGHLYVEPAANPWIVMGSCRVLTETTARVFHLSDNNRLSFAIQRGRFMSVDLDMHTLDGNPLLNVVNGYVEYRNVEYANFAARPGRINVTAPVSDRVIPYWVLADVRQYEADFALDGKVTLLDAEVTKPGEVTIKGFWTEDGHLVLATGRRLYVAAAGTALSSFRDIDFAPDIGPGPVADVAAVFTFGFAKSSKAK